MSGGSISGNTADSGGGVYTNSGSVFNKSGGTIFGSDGGDNKNTATAVGSGHAVYINSSGWILPPYRDTTI
jgi:hypothetical protein